MLSQTISTLILGNVLCWKKKLRWVITPGKRPIGCFSVRGEGCIRNGRKQTELMSGMVGAGEVENDYQEALRAS